MADKNLRLKPHRIKENGKVIENVWVYEEPSGLWIYTGQGIGYTIKWSCIRAALKRKDK